ncbi:MAG: transcription termination/antitermination protein NusG [Bernardetiaceae bacterium]
MEENNNNIQADTEAEGQDPVKWYIVRVVSGQEKKIKTYLEKDVEADGLQAYICRVLTPTEKVFQIRKMKDGKNKKVALEKNFYPGYILIQANLEENNSGEIIHRITNTPGIIGFLEVDGRAKEDKPKAMRPKEAQRILARIEKNEETAVGNQVQFIIGESVKVMEGPFSDFTGVVEEVFDEKKKLKVMVKIFGRNTPIELNYAQAEKLD